MGRTKTTKKKFFIDCSTPVADSVLDPASFEKFLHDKIKVYQKDGKKGKAGELGDTVTISLEKAKIVVSTDAAKFSKRYLKYLTKKYLKKQQLRDYLRVIASNKQTFDLRYFNVGGEAAEGEEEES